MVKKRELGLGGIVLYLCIYMPGCPGARVPGCPGALVCMHYIAYLQLQWCRCANLSWVPTSLYKAQSVMWSNSTFYVPTECKKHTYTSIPGKKTHTYRYDSERKQKSKNNMGKWIFYTIKISIFDNINYSKSLNSAKPH